MEPVGIVGVGNMGGAMAARLLEQGWPVRVFDIDPAKVSTLHAQGATACRDAADAARGCSALIVCVVDAQQTGEVLFGAQGAAADEPRAHVALLQKDTRLAVEAAAGAGFEGPLGAAARDVFARAAAAGLTQLDDAALFQLLARTGDTPEV